MVLVVGTHNNGPSQQLSRLFACKQLQPSCAVRHNFNWLLLEHITWLVLLNNTSQGETLQILLKIVTKLHHLPALIFYHNTFEVFDIISNTIFALTAQHGLFLYIHNEYLNLLIINFGGFLISIVSANRHNDNEDSYFKPVRFTSF